MCQTTSSVFKFRSAAITLGLDFQRFDNGRQPIVPPDHTAVILARETSVTGFVSEKPVQSVYTPIVYSVL